MGRYARPHWDATAGQWCQLIGYTTNRNGARVRRRFYFGAEESKAGLESIAKQIEWKAIVEASRPLWAHGEVKPPPSTPSNITIAEAVTQFVAHKKNLVGLAGGKGIKPSTFNQIETTLDLALGRDSIDTSKPLASLDKATLESFVQKWMKLPDEISTRTSINYCNAFKQLLDWCHGQHGWQKPHGTDALFSFRATSTPNGVRYDQTALKSLLSEAKQNPKTLLYVLLALQCGMYQSDISEIRHSELIVEKGETFICRQRTKMKGADETTDSGNGHIKVWLFPETLSLLRQFAEDTGDRILCNQYGQTLCEFQVGKCPRDAISPAYERVTSACGSTIRFKDLRKFGWQSMKRIGGSDEVARKWAGQQVTGISRNYNHDDFKDVTKALKQWRKELISAKVLPTGRVCGYPYIA